MKDRDDMKQKVKYSVVPTVLFSCLIVFLGIMASRFMDKGEPGFFYGLSFALCICFLSALFYVPVAISVDDRRLRVHRLLFKKDIPLSDIESIRLCPPTMGERRLCGSGGFFGYWGWFSERDLGRYFAYYGKASDCFLVTLKSGRKYMLGCENPEKIVDFVRSHTATAV